MTPDPVAQLRAALEASGLTTRDFARRVLLRNPGTLHRWLAGDSPIPTPVRDWLNRKRPKNGTGAP